MKQAIVKIPLERVENVILLIRGEKVILDTDLAELYGVETRALIQAVKRNNERFPADFMFQLTSHEFESLRSQFVISKRRGGRRYKPYAFTEHGAIMAANVLNSERAVQASVQVVRAFIKLREMLASSVELSRKLDQLEKKYDDQFKIVFDAIRQLMTPVTSENQADWLPAKSLEEITARHINYPRPPKTSDQSVFIKVRKFRLELFYQTHPGPVLPLLLRSSTFIFSLVGSQSAGAVFSRD